MVSQWLFTFEWQLFVLGLVCICIGYIYWDGRFILDDVQEQYHKDMIATAYIEEWLYCISSSCVCCRL